jgi:hypothetical protein
MRAALLSLETLLSGDSPECVRMVAKMVKAMKKGGR